MFLRFNSTKRAEDLPARHLPPLPGGSDIKYSLPRPIVLDTNLRSSAESKLLGNYRRGVGRRPWIIASAPEGSSGAATSWNEKKLALEQAGAKVVNVQSSEGTPQSLKPAPSNSMNRRRQDLYPAFSEDASRTRDPVTHG